MIWKICLSRSLAWEGSFYTSNTMGGIDQCITLDDDYAAWNVHFLSDWKIKISFSMPAQQQYSTGTDNNNGTEKSSE